MLGRVILPATSLVKMKMKTKPLPLILNYYILRLFLVTFFLIPSYNTFSKESNNLKSGVLLHFFPVFVAKQLVMDITVGVYKNTSL